MLSKMRDHRRNRVMQVIVYSMFAVIIVVFAISFGPGSWGQGGLASATHAAKVDGTIITAMEFERAYGEYLNRYREIMGESLTPEQAEGLGIRGQILESLIERQLVVQNAPKIGVQVPDGEVSRLLLEVEAFHTDGRFDQELFQRYVENVLGSTTGRFFENIREDILYQRVLQAVRAGVKVSPSEVWDRFVDEYDRTDLEYVRLTPTLFREEADPALERIDELIDERYDEVKEFYELNEARYHHPEEIRARHVLIGTEPDSSLDDRAAAREKAEHILEKAREGADFARLAEEYSDDPGSRAAGGDLDWFARGRMVPAFEEAAFSLSPGELSDVVETPFGYHVILFEDRREASVEPLDEVEREIAREILEKELAEQLARNKAENILKEALEGRTLTDVVGKASEEEPSLDLGDFGDLEGMEELRAKIEAEKAPRSEGVTAARTGLEPIRGGEIRGIGQSHELAAMVTDLTEEAPVIPEIVEVDGALFVVRLAERTRPDPEIFEQEKDRLRDELLRTRQDQVQNAFLQALRDQARVQVNEALLSRR